jgi:hypothetical protein
MLNIQCSIFNCTSIVAIVKKCRPFVETQNKHQVFYRGLDKSICMKSGIIIFAAFSFFCLTARSQNFIGSTPANAAVKSFLGIPLSDSVDFIRWKLNINAEKFDLSCNYGIGKPGTNGFIDGGKHVGFSGLTRMEKSYFILRHENKMLWLIQINQDLLHLLDSQKKLLIGNGGWSYTLNNFAPSHSPINNLRSLPMVIRDSTVFDGRTPCGVPDIIEPGKLCYKLKWRIVLYANAAYPGDGRYRVLGTGLRAEGGRKGNWTRINSRDEKIMYELKDSDGNGWLYLQQLDDHILIFSDRSGKLLVGDEDFSYTLNRMK